AQGVVDRIGGDAVHVAPSCSLLHLPVDRSREDALDPEIRSWLSFATERLDEIRTIREVLEGRGTGVAAALAANRDAAASRRTSARVHRPGVAERVAAVTPDLAARTSPYPVRRAVQAEVLDLPV